MIWKKNSAPFIASLKLRQHKDAAANLQVQKRLDSLLKKRGKFGQIQQEGGFIGAILGVFKKADLRQWLPIWPTIGLPFGIPLACLLAYPWAYMLHKLEGHVLQYRRARDQ